jgi:integrase/recombinase XerD
LKLSTALQGFVIHLNASAYSTITIDYYSRNVSTLASFLGDPDVASITTSHIQAFYSSLRAKNLSLSSIQVYWKVIRSFYNWAEHELDLPTRPDKAIPAPKFQPKQIEPFTKEDIQKLLAACKGSRRNRAIILLLLDTGLRVSEAARLVVSDLVLDTGMISVRPYQTSRKSRPRVVFLGVAARSAMWKYMASREKQDRLDPLIATLDNRPLNRSSIKCILVRLSRASGVTNVHPHRFRHTMAIEYLRAGGDVFTLQKLLGHASLEMVKGYLKLAESDLASAHRRSSPVDHWRL